MRHNQFAAVNLDLPTAIEEPVEISVPKDLVVATTATLPGLVVDQNHFSGGRGDELQPDTRHVINEEFVDEQLLA